MTTTPPRRRKTARRFIWPAATAAALLVGVGIGSASTEPTVKVVEGPAPAPKVERVTEYKTPESCIESVDAGESLVQQIADYLGAESEAWTAASTFSTAALQAASAAKDKEADKLVTSVQDYLTPARNCTADNS